MLPGLSCKNRSIQRSILDTLFLFSCGFFLACVLASCNENGRTIQASEPNDSIATALEVPLNSVVQDSFFQKGDRDFFRFKIEETQILSLELSKVKGMDLQMRVYRIDPKENEIIKVVDDHHKNLSERLANLLVEPGEYGVEVLEGQNQEILFIDQSEYTRLSFFPTENYRLEIQTRYLNPEEEWESNDSLEKAQAIQVDKTIHGFFSPFQNLQNTNLKKLPRSYRENFPLEYSSLDWDWYRIYIGESGFHSLRFTLSGVDEVDGVLALYSEERLIQWGNHYGLGVEEQIFQASLEGQKNYYLLVIGLPSVAIQDTNYSYELYFKKEMRKGSFESEDNNDFIRANVILSNQEIQGFLSSFEDEDFYFLDLEPNRESLVTLEGHVEKDNQEEKEQEGEDQEEVGQEKIEETVHKPVLQEELDMGTDLKNVPLSMQVELGAVDEVDLEVALYDEQKRFLRVYNSHQKGEKEKVHSFVVDSLKAVYLRVRSATVPVTHKIKRKENFQEPYTLKAQVEYLSPNQEREPNENDPQRLYLGQPIQAYLNPKSYFHRELKQKGDIDFYRIEILAVPLPAEVKEIKEGVGKEIDDKNEANLEKLTRRQYQLVIRGTVPIELRFRVLERLNYGLSIQESGTIRGNSQKIIPIQAEWEEAQEWIIEIQGASPMDASSKNPYTVLFREAP